jgi:hypothetical protein
MNFIKVILLIGLTVCAHAVQSQYSRLKGASAIQLAVGFTDVGMLVSAHYQKTFDKKIKAGLGGGLVFGTIATIHYKSLFLDGSGAYSLYSNQLFSFNAIAGISFVGDFKNEFPSDAYSKQFSFNYGILGGAEAEFVATRKLSFALIGLQRYYMRKDFGNLRYHMSAAIRATL